MDYIIAMLDLFYANKHMYDRLQRQRRKESNEKCSLNQQKVNNDGQQD